MKMEHITNFKVIITATFAAFTACFGWLGWLVVLYVACMAIDWITGSVAACKAGEWNSRIAREGLWHKGGSIAAVAVSAIADCLLGLVINNIPAISIPFTYTVLICPIVMVWYILTELGSIIENAGKMGAPIPAFLKKIIAAFKDKVDEAGDKLADSEKTE